MARRGKSKRRGVWPCPVYEAHMSDGEVFRLSYWHPADQPLDGGRGRRLAMQLRTPGVWLIRGYICHSGQVWDDMEAEGRRHGDQVLRLMRAAADKRAREAWRSYRKRQVVALRSAGERPTDLGPYPFDGSGNARLEWEAKLHERNATQAARVHAWEFVDRAKAAAWAAITSRKLFRLRHGGSTEIVPFRPRRAA